LSVAENLLGQDFTVTAPKQGWVSDLSDVPTAEGWLYCAAHKDLFNGEIVGYALGSRITTELVSQSLLRSVVTRRPPWGLISHSDRGSQYGSPSYQKLLNQFGMKASMSGKGNYYDNAPMESFWGTLKSKLGHHRRYPTREEAIQEISEYIEVFYNRERRQARLGYLSPAAYVKQYYVSQAAAWGMFRAAKIASRIFCYDFKDHLIA
jgi:transposase InsO family protein